MTPLKPRMGKTLTLLLALLTWILGILIGIPSLIFFQTETDGSERVICYMKWPDVETGKINESMQEYM